MFDATASTDRLIELILQEDKDVLKQLLTTDKVVATRTDNLTSAGSTPTKKSKRSSQPPKKRNRSRPSKRRPNSRQRSGKLPN